MVVKTDKDNKITGHVMTAIKNKHLAVDNPESYEILLGYFKMIKERLDKMQEDVLIKCRKIFQILNLIQK